MANARRQRHLRRVMSARSATSRACRGTRSTRRWGRQRPPGNVTGAFPRAWSLRPAEAVFDRRGQTVERRSDDCVSTKMDSTISWRRELSARSQGSIRPPLARRSPDRGSIRSGRKSFPRIVQKRYEVASATRPRPGIRSNGSGIDLLRPIGAIAPRRLGCNSAMWNC
jgi:hypothetical protein